MSGSTTIDEDTGLPDLVALRQAIAVALPPYDLVALRFHQLAGISELLGFASEQAIFRVLSANLTAALGQGEQLFRTHHFGLHILLPGHDSHLNLSQGGLRRQRRLQEIVSHARRPVVAQGHSFAFKPSVAGLEVKGTQDAVTADVALKLLEAASDAAWRANDEKPVWRDTTRSTVLDADEVLKGELAAAMEIGQVEAWFTPVIYAPTGGVAMIEPTMRWAHPRFGCVEADQVRRVAYSAGLARQLDAATLDIAIKSLARWRQQGLQLLACVEISPESLADRFFADRLAAKCNASELDPRTLILQVPESAMFLDHGIQTHLTALRNLGLVVWVTGFRHVATAPTVLWGEAIVGLRAEWPALALSESSPNARSSAMSTIAIIARSQGLSVMAAGVATAEDAKAIKKHRVISFVQGPYFGPPMRSTDIPTFVRQQGPAAPPMISPFSI